MANCPNCGREIDIGAQFCRNCGSKISETGSGTSVGPQVQVPAPLAQTETGHNSKFGNTNEMLQSNLSRALKPIVKQEEKILTRIPTLEALEFWLIVGGLLLFYCGVSEIVLRYGPGLGFAIGAVLVGLFYIYLSWIHYNEQGKDWIIQTSIGLPFLVIIGDFIVTGVFSTLSALLVIVNLLIIYNGLKQRSMISD